MIDRVTTRLGAALLALILLAATAVATTGALAAQSGTSTVTIGGNVNANDQSSCAGDDGSCGQSQSQTGSQGQTILQLNDASSTTDGFSSVTTGGESTGGSDAAAGETSRGDSGGSNVTSLDNSNTSAQSQTQTERGQSSTPANSSTQVVVSTVSGDGFTRVDTSIEGNTGSNDQRSVATAVAPTVTADGSSDAAAVSVASLANGDGNGNTDGPTRASDIAEEGSTTYAILVVMLGEVLGDLLD